MRGSLSQHVKILVTGPLNNYGKIEGLGSLFANVKILSFGSLFESVKIFNAGSLCDNVKINQLVNFFYSLIGQPFLYCSLKIKNVGAHNPTNIPKRSA